MSYNYTKASDLVAWSKEQLNKSTKYRLGGIGRYENGVRIFDCIGLVKCFLWHDYSSSNARYYGKTAPDYNCEQYFNIAKEKGPISSIPELPGVIVYQRGHVGIYIGNGEVIEATAAFSAKVVKSYFKGSHSGYKRTTWTHWFKLPQLTYDAIAVETVSKSVDELAREVIAGNWGNGQDRKDRLRAAGYSYSAVQARVNEMLSGNKPKLKDTDTIAREVIRGNWGNGAERKRRLEAAGYNYRTIQNRVNQLLR